MFERMEIEVIYCNAPYRVIAPAVGKYEVVLGEKMKEVKVQYLGSVQCKHEGMEREIRERTVKGRCVIGSLTRIMRGRNVSMEIKRGIRNNILLPTLKYGSETWTWNRAQQSRVCGVEINYLRGGVRAMKVYKRCDMEPCTNGVKCGVVE